MSQDNALKLGEVQVHVTVIDDIGDGMAERGEAPSLPPESFKWPLIDVPEPEIEKPASFISRFLSPILGDKAEEGKKDETPAAEVLAQRLEEATGKFDAEAVASALTLKVLRGIPAIQEQKEKYEDMRQQLGVEESVKTDEFEELRDEIMKFLDNHADRISRRTVDMYDLQLTVAREQRDLMQQLRDELVVSADDPTERVQGMPLERGIPVPEPERTPRERLIDLSETLKTSITAKGKRRSHRELIDPEQEGEQQRLGSRQIVPFGGAWFARGQGMAGMPPEMQALSGAGRGATRSVWNPERVGELTEDQVKRLLDEIRNVRRGQNDATRDLMNQLLAIAAGTVDDVQNEMER